MKKPEQYAAEIVIDGGYDRNGSHDAGEYRNYEIPLPEEFKKAVADKIREVWNNAIEAALITFKGKAERYGDLWVCQAQEIEGLKIPTQEVKVSDALNLFERSVFNKATRKKAG